MKDWKYHFSILFDEDDKPTAAFYAETNEEVVGPFEKKTDTIGELFDIMKSVVTEHQKGIEEQK